MPGLGRRLHHDPKSREYPARIAPTVGSVLWTHNAPILDQGSTNSCTGHALAQLLNTTKFVHSRPSRRYLDHADALDLYAVATGLDEFPGGVYPPVDEGSSSLGVCKAGVRLGYLTRYEHAFGLDHMLAALQLQPLIVGTSWYSGMTWCGTGLAKPTGKYLGGHEYLCLGAGMNSRQLVFLNSWGPEWPTRNARGRFRIGFADFASLLEDQGDATVPIGRP